MLSIITPTYNRAYLLPRLYDSLTNQTCKEFEWIVIDDGSIDSTKELVERWKLENVFEIKYIYQENSGKYIAHNTGVLNATGELCMCVDSDDYISNQCVEKILNKWKIKENSYLAGIIALKATLDGRLIGDKFPEFLEESTLFELSEKYKNNSDKTLIYKTSILKKFLFPNFPNTKFITECVVYDQIDKVYKSLLYNEILCYCEYQNDGYSKNYRKLMLNNPIGFNIYYLQRIDLTRNLKERIKYAGKYLAFKWLSGKQSIKYVGKYNLFIKFCYPIGFLFYIYYLFIKLRIGE